MATSHREIDENGFLTVRGNPISSFGIFDYSAGQLGLPGDPMRIVKVYRPESAVSDPAAIESFKNVPFIIEHAMLSGDELDDDDKAAGIVSTEDKGMDGILTGNVYYDAPWMRGDLKIFTKKGRKYIESGMQDLSLGYGCRFRHEPGNWNGQDYEVVQDNMRGNHIALVPEGRVSGARVLDAKVFDSKAGDGGGFTAVMEELITLEGEEMKIKRTAAMDNAVEQLLSIIPALKTFLEQEAAEPAHQEAGAEGQAAQTGNENFGAENNEGSDAGAEGAQAEGAGANEMPDISNLIAQVEECLAQLRAMAGQGATGQDEDEQGQPGAQATEDAVEGLQNEGHKASPTADEAGSAAENDNNGKASPGPEGGLNAKAGDAAVRAVYADLAAKARIYDGVSEIVGAFDHAAMDARQVAAYGVKKLGIKGVSPGKEIAAIDLYLQGRKAAKPAPKGHQQSRAADGKGSGFSVPKSGSGDAKLDAYLAGGN